MSLNIEETTTDISIPDTKEFTMFPIDEQENALSEPDDIHDHETVKKEGKKKPDGAMPHLMMSGPNPPSEGDLVEGPVIAVLRAAVYVDIPPFGTGIIYGREYLNARDIIRKITIGDRIAAKVIDLNNEDGYIELSLREARQTLIWKEMEEYIRNKIVLELQVRDANKGGLILEWQGIQGFLPASQLIQEHYPRVEDGDKDKILDELRKLVGKHLSVSIIAASPSENKLIFSEKGALEQEKREIVKRYNIGNEVEGIITGTVDFGLFVKIEHDIEGLVHISEIDWALVEDPRKIYAVGDTVRVKIIDIKDGKMSLSIKALKENPWIAASEKYKKGDRVQGVIIKYNKHGALASVEEGVAGLIHISEFDGDSDLLHRTLELGKTYPFVITIFDVKEQRMALSHKQTTAVE